MGVKNDLYYGKNGNQTKLIYTEKNNPVVIEFEYESDSQNNWIKQIKFVKGKKLYVWTREIEYFE